MRIVQIVRRVTRVASGTNATVAANPGLSLAQRFSYSPLANFKPAAVLANFFTARVGTDAGVSVVTSAGGTGSATVDAGIDTATRGVFAGTLAVPAANMTQITYSLTHRSGAATVSETSIGGRTDWADDSNATGLNNGTNATFAGSAIGARGGRLVFTYADLIGKSGLTISAVRLHFYVTVSGTVVNNADVRLLRSLNGAGFSSLQTITGDSSSVPITHVITSEVAGSWAALDTLQTGVQADAALGETWTATCDAVEVEIVAPVTDTL